jgi:hypothetical protein
MFIILRIELGNDTMQSSKDVADSLEKVANRFRDNEYVEIVATSKDASITRGILDRNGSTVGEFHVEHSR